MTTLSQINLKLFGKIVINLKMCGKIILTFVL